MNKHIGSSFDEEGVREESHAPSLLTEIRTSDMPAVYQRFADVVRDRIWARRVEKIEEEIKRHRFLKTYLCAENEIAFSLNRCRELIERGAVDAVANQSDLYAAISFAAQSLSMIDMATPVEAKRLCKRVAGDDRSKGKDF
ncbi:MAG: hypothetical protein LBP52_04005 [Burkholderiaceae bacterium]|jgi:hypothetical protein|nr:hypothetical protein [Burkholderiaceae bacterium]